MNRRGTAKEASAKGSTCASWKESQIAKDRRNDAGVSAALRIPAYLGVTRRFWRLLCDLQLHWH